MKLGTAIKVLRKEKGFLQKDFAKQCGLTANAYCSIENNNAMPRKETVKIICDNLEVSEPYLLLSCIFDTKVKKERQELFKMLCLELAKFLIKHKNGKPKS